MSQKPLTVSIVIPAYNEEDYIGACLQAISEQTTAPDEVIVVDNNSSDKTIEIAEAFPFVHLVKEKQQGLYFSRQTGMSLATGDILGRIDADTILDANWVEEVKRSFTPKVQAMTGPFAYYDMPLPRISIHLDDTSRRIAARGGYSFLSGANMAIRRTAWELIEGELCNQPFLFEDIDIVQHLKELGLTPVYNRKMKAAMSARRFADKPRDFMKYIGGHTRTLDYHDQPSPWGAHFAEGMFSLGYVMLKPLHHAYDPIENRLSLRKMIYGSQARPDPMNVKQSD